MSQRPSRPTKPSEAQAISKHTKKQSKGQDHKTKDVKKLSRAHEQRWIFQAWDQWRLGLNRAPLDQFIKQKAGEWRRKFGYPLPLGASQKLFDAARFAPLVSALEFTFQKERQPNSEEWLQFASDDQINDISSDAFWYWLSKRTGAQITAADGWQAGNRENVWQAIKQQLEDMSFKDQLSADLEQLDSIQSLENLNSHPWQWLWFGWSPGWIVAALSRAKCSAWNTTLLKRFIESQAQRPATYLRVAHPEQLDEITAEFENKDIRFEIVKTPVSDGRSHTAIAIRGGMGVHQTEAYQQGHIEIQDLASQLAAAKVSVSNKQTVWDCCAGAGGKTLAIAQALGRKGSITATDNSGKKLAELKRRAKRAQALNIRTFEWQGDEPLVLPKAIAQKAGFDWVIADVPCSGSGTSRRNPDIYWDRTNSDYIHDSHLLELQSRLLSLSSQSVRPGGQLVYMTCSWLTAENEQQVATFLSQHPEFELVEQTMVGQPEVDSDCLFVAHFKKQTQ